MSAARFATVALALVAIACSEEGRPAGINMSVPGLDAATGPDGPYLEGGFQDGPPPADAEGFCGNQFFEVTPEPPNLYFVLDRSGSMLDRAVPTSSVTKYAAVRGATVEMVVALGHRVNVGAAVFPGSPSADECSSGKEVFATQPGDAPGSFDGGFGPVSATFSAATNVQPKGGTPIAATLESLRPILANLEGSTAVVLATDGGPNCSTDHECGPEDCIWNIEGAKLNEEWCTPTYNCCDTSIYYGPGANGCLDGSATVAAVAALRDAGIRTYVVGIPGSEFYVSLLDQLATVGGSARSGETKYYRVDDVSNLGATLAAIGEKALITCEFVLEAKPPDADFVNVYFDHQSVPYDETDGWTWTSDTTLSLHGEACEKLKSGDVAGVQVVAGCPTQQPR